jgi:hypothetical protein
MQLSIEQLEQLVKDSRRYEVYRVAKPRNGAPINLTKKSKSYKSAHWEALSLVEAQALISKLDKEDKEYRHWYQEKIDVPRVPKIQTRKSKVLGRKPMAEKNLLSTRRHQLYLNKGQTNLVETIRSENPDLIKLKDAAFMRRLIVDGVEKIKRGSEKKSPPIPDAQEDRERFKGYKPGFTESEYSDLMSLNEGTFQDTMLVALWSAIG